MTNSNGIPEMVNMQALSVRNGFKIDSYCKNEGLNTEFFIISLHKPHRGRRKTTKSLRFVVAGLFRYMLSTIISHAVD